MQFDCLEVREAVSSVSISSYQPIKRSQAMGEWRRSACRKGRICDKKSKMRAREKLWAGIHAGVPGCLIHGLGNPSGGQERPTMFVAPEC